MKWSWKGHAGDQGVDTSYRVIPLTHNLNTIVDAADFEWLSQWNWLAAWSPTSKSFYARRLEWMPEREIWVHMHRLILGCSATEEGDHEDGDTLNNRRPNLRKASHAQNQQNKEKTIANTHGYKGITWLSDVGKWRSKITVNGKDLSLGYFHSKEEAARAYDEAAKLHPGKFARLNFVEVKV